MQNKRIDCILRLIKINDIYSDICVWLIEQKIVTRTEAEGQSRDQEKAEFLYHAFKKGVELEKFQLLDYEWTILPLEQIKITCITDRETKEFTYGH